MPRCYWYQVNRAPDNGAYDGLNARSFISAVSEMTHPSDTCDGAADDDAGEARMDSELLVRGYCTDESNPEVFDRVNVRGDIRFSDIHHNWFGQ
ncbi:MEP7c [Ectocarpus sp. CCAP 1310/34]|nr:MEP7c [Ectocarpus sp. CCAP 1310/34]